MGNFAIFVKSFSSTFLRASCSFTCMVKGYEESARKIKEIGATDVNQYKVYIKFDCILVDPIVPPPKPKVLPKSELTT